MNLPPTKPEAEWIRIVREDVAQAGSISATADRIGVSRSALSQVLNGVGPYGTGLASTAKIELKVMNSIGLVQCPFLSEYHGAERRITGLQCREVAYRQNPPTNSAREMAHWRACQTCPKRVTPAAPVEPPPGPTKAPAKAKTVKPATAAEATLGLPVVGAPQPMPPTASPPEPPEEKQPATPDTATMPLPGVGAPQIAVQTHQEAA